MTSKTLKSAIWLTLAVGATALAAGGPPPGKGGGGGGGEETLTNNLSVPTIMINGAFTGVTCGNQTWSVLREPAGVPETGFPIDPLAYYYVQGKNTWQAECMDLQAPNSHSVFGAWGDNLTGDAKLRAGSPIRVELVLSDAVGLQALGYTVVKLEPSKLDRESAYGTLASGTAPPFSATSESKVAGVFDGDASMTITGPDFLVSEDPAGAEINATGKAVYGYNLRVPTAGKYLITFTMPNVIFTGCDAGTCIGDTATLEINVGAGGGGGGGKGGGKPPGAGEGE
jgi:hypothetical protein